MSLTDKLLKLDAGIACTEQYGEVEIKRLSKQIGEPFVVKCKALQGKEYTEISMAVVDEKRNKVDYSKAYEANLRTALSGIMEPDLKDKDLLKHYGCPTPKDLMEKLFNGGEIATIAGLVTDLSGYGDDAEGELKN